MGHYISLHSGGYYEGDRASHLDIEVPQRPSVLHVWDGAAWVLDAQAQRDALQAQIDALEQKAIENRKWREYSIIQMEEAATAYGAAQVPPLDAATSLAYAYAVNTAYQKTKDLDVQITALRTQKDAIV